MRKVRWLWRAALLLLLAAVLIVGGYFFYAFASYYRLEDDLALPVEHTGTKKVQRETAYTLLSYNLGFGAYSADYSFFMDGGKYSRAFSKSAVYENISGALSAMQTLDPEFVLLQEVDTDSTRSYHVNEVELVTLPECGLVYAQNYDSPYLFWPLTCPHGSSKSGIVTQSVFQMDSALRRSLPVETGFSKFYDLDRCYSVVRLPVEGGGTLCLYNVHLSAYTTDGTIATQQLQLLLDDMAAEQEAGNYVICSGDFNKDLLGDSGAIFGVSGGANPWAQPFPDELLPAEISLVTPLDGDNPVASCRNADRPYDPQTDFRVTVDGFLVSNQVEVQAAAVLDTGYAWSDHNPVQLKFILKK